MTERSYRGRVALAFDRFGNALWGGDPDHTLSASVGAWAFEGARWALIVEKLFDAIVWAFTLGKAPMGHCRRQAQREGLIPPIDGGSLTTTAV